MANKMLIDATHPEETRVVVLRGNRVEEFDFESAQRKQLRGNIYLAKVTRVEPSLQAAFVDYGGNRHGFLAFSEIHPDYYQIPVADRQALIDEEERAQRAADDEIDRRSRRHRHRPARQDSASHRRHDRGRDTVMRGDLAEAPAGDAAPVEHFVPPPGESDEANGGTAEVETIGASTEGAETAPAVAETAAPAAETADAPALDDEIGEAEIENGHEAAAEAADNEADVDRDETDHDEADRRDTDSEAAGAAPGENGETSSGTEEVGDHDENGENGENGEDEEVVESVGGSDALEEASDRAPRHRRQYKIQEVIKRRQVMLVQVVKEERGTKGAALTTYLSLAGRYSVLMPNTARGGGISRKITDSEDRARLKEAASELEVPEGMGVILRTAGASRTKIEIKRDFEYLLRMWETVRDLTLKSTAPKLVYEEGSLVKRSIRDLYSKDIDEVTVAGTEAYHEAKDFMRMLMPSHARNVKPYNDTQPLLARYGVENQLDAMFSPTVQLRSGGYIVINQAEALVAIDVNSGRATREHHIEDTALKTNLEASDEIARQLRLRDLAGLIVIDFIDMDEKRNNRSVERRLKECLKHDRARIQVGRISHFGLLEMSRQRIRSSVLESSTEKCPYCGGTGHVRSVSSLALQVLRALEEQLMRGATHNLIARTRPDVALYMLNQKRAHLRGLEERFVITIMVSADESVTAPQAFVIDRGEQVHTVEAAKAIAERTQVVAAPMEDEDDLEDIAAAEAEEPEHAAPEAAPEAGEGVPRRPRRRRRRRGGRNGDEAAAGEAAEHLATGAPADEFAPDSDHDMPIAHDAAADREAPSDDGPVAEDELGEQQGREFVPHERGEGGERRRRRGRRGGRRNRQRNGDTPREAHDSGSQEQPADAMAAPDYAPRETEQKFAAADELYAPPATEPALKEAVADLDAAPPAPAPAAEAEPVRRRSTVREPAPFTGGEDVPASAPVAAPPAPAPVIAESNDATEADRPRRTGWWARRFAGG
jgi:ribonuclease E